MGRLHGAVRTMTAPIGPYSHNTGGSMEGRLIRQGYVSGALGRVGLGGAAEFGCWLNDALGGALTGAAAGGAFDTSRAGKVAAAAGTGFATTMSTRCAARTQTEPSTDTPSGWDQFSKDVQDQMAAMRSDMAAQSVSAAEERVAAAEQKTKTLMYVGGGVAAVAAVGLLVWLLK